MSASSIARLKASWQAEYHERKPRSLADLEPVYLWADGIYVQAGLEKDKAAMLVILDGQGIWSALAAVFPQARPQRCWNHRILNLFDKLPKRLQAEGQRLVTAIPYAETPEDAERQKRRSRRGARRRA